jgi:DNA-binding transcriptional LysR family regulator
MLNEMVVFAQVVECGGFSAAARMLEVEASSVSRSVARLEKKLGTRLLHRTTRAIALTEIGEQVFKECALIARTARDITSLTNSYGDAPRGVLRLSAPVVFGQLWLAPRLAGFMAAWPAVDLRISLIDRPVDLLEDGVDVAIRIAADWAPGLVARKIGSVRYVLVASPSYLAKNGMPAEPADLPAHCCLYPGHGAFGADWQMHRGERSATVTVASRITLNNSLAIVTAAEGGGGIGLVPDFAARAALDAGRVVPVLPDWRFQAPYARDVSLVWMPGRHVPHKVRVFVDYLLSTI